MRKYFIKFICLLMTSVFFFSSAVTVFAQSFSSEGLIYSVETEYDNIRKSETGEYALVTEGNQYVPVGRMDLDLADQNAVQRFVKMSNIEPEIKEYILQKAQASREKVTCNSQTITIFSQDLLPPQHPESRGEIYSVYNGMRMKTYQIIETNIETGYHTVATGHEAKDWANALDEIALIILGEVIDTISFGDTLLGIFEAMADANVVYTSARDFVQINVKYDNTMQWTYGQYDGETWLLGYGSQKITIRRIDVKEQFVIDDNGTQKQFSTYTNVTKKSSAFDNPGSVAYYHLNSPVEEWIGYKAGPLTFYFI